MASPFDSAGANHEGSDYAPLTMDRYITGLVTNRNPLRDAEVSYVQAKFYQAGRFDSIWDGIDMEVSAQMELVRRYGSSIFNGASWYPVTRYYAFRTQVDGQDVIRTIADTAPAVYDATGGAQTLVWKKSVGAGKTSFQSVGNTLYMGNGVDQIKWTIPTKSYKTQTAYNAGDFINDPNGNIQVAFGYAQASVVSSQSNSGPHPIGFPAIINRVVLNFGSAIPFTDGQEVSFAGLGLAAVLNGQTFPITKLSTTALRVQLSYPIASFGPGADVGIAFAGGSGSNASGVSGTTAPAWSTTPGGVTTDGTVLWVNKGSAVQAWGTAAPTIAPTVTQQPVVSAYPNWAASTYFSTNNVTYNAATPTCYAQLAIGGTTGGSEPTFNPTIGHATADGTATWVTFNALWLATTGFVVGNVIVRTVAGVLTAFNAIVTGLTGATEPFWVGPIGAQINDGTVVWQNVGPVVEWTSIGASVNVSTATTILDSGGFLQNVQAAGLSGSTPPTWNETLTQLTTDGGVTWVNAGAYATAGSQPSKVAYSFASSLTLTESNLSPATTFSLREGKNAVYQGPGSNDPQIDTINIYRTLQGGSTFFFDGSIPAPVGGAGALWRFVDTLSETGLSANFEIQRAINSSNNPPPVGLVALCYHMGRIWGAVGILQYFCTGPDATVGNGNEAWAPANVFAMPDAIARSVPWDLPNGVLLVFTAGGPQAVWGTGTASPQIPFYVKPFTQGSGLLSFDALDTAGPWIHMFTTDMRLLSFQPTAGYTSSETGSEDAGATIGDQFLKVTTGGINTALYTPAGTYVTWHTAGTNDTGLFVCDGAVGWFRLAPISPPESGYNWSPRAAIVGGTSAVQSVETQPGIKTLLIGPPKPANVVLTISNIVIAGGLATITHSNLFLPTDNTPIALAGLTTVPALNGATVNVDSATNGQFQFVTTLPDQATAAETGTGTVDGAWVKSGPILKRDTAVNSDNGQNYPGPYATIGSIQLAQPTEEAEVAEIILDSAHVGTPPTVAVLLGEINPTAEAPFVALEKTGVDPPLLAPSQTLYNDRFTMMQNGHGTYCRHMQLKIVLASEDQPSAILTHTIYGRRLAERKNA